MSERPTRPTRPTNQKSVKPTKPTTNQSTKPNVEEEIYIESDNVNVGEKQKGLTREEKLKQIEQEMAAKRKKRIIKIIITILILIILGVGYYFLSTGLNDSRVVNLNKEVEKLNAIIVNNERRIAELKQAVEDTTVKEVVPETSLQRVGASEVPEFVMIEGDFIAPNKLELPTIFDDVNNSFVQIGSKFKFKPSDNWRMIVQGTILEFNHPAQIWGKIKALGHKDKVESADMQKLIQNFFVGYPATTISYRKIFIADNVSGMIGKADITIKETAVEGVEAKEKQMTLNVGFVQRGDYTLQFMFAYDKDAVVAQELIDALLQSGKYGEESLKLE